MTDADTNSPDVIPPVDALMPVLNFTDDDLRANREGHLSERQHYRLLSLRRRSIQIGVGTLVTLIFITTTVLYLGWLNSSTILNVLGTGLIVINAVMVGMFGRHWMRLTGDLNKREVAIVEGAMERVVRPQRRVNSYLLRIGDAEFSVNKDTFRLFRHETPYRLYVAPYANILLAAEPIG